jgi:hypothetical protein
VGTKPGMVDTRGLEASRGGAESVLGERNGKTSQPVKNITTRNTDKKVLLRFI